MIQAGGFTRKLEEKPTLEPIKNEAKNRLRNRKFTVAMARTNEPDSARAQFFINLRNNVNLDYRPKRPGYAVFGKLVDGMAVAEDIARVKTTSLGAGFDDFPEKLIKIKRAYVLGEQQSAPAPAEGTAADKAKN